MAYRVMGPYKRQIGKHINDGEAVHQSVLDRMQLAKCDYNPSNIKGFHDHQADIPVVNTQGIERGEPCPDI
jgi:hypothetical protein